MSDDINHPEHYGGDGNVYEVINVLDAWGLTENAYLWNVVKYVARAGKKVGESKIKDLRKAQWYLNRHIVLCELAEKKAQMERDRDQRPTN